ncbi:MAG: HAD hydrolase family protein, partial [Muribaculaceae bacterium]|nr:HAD hydrolase family protein [Muribaculaceae bacterium]
RSFMVGRESRFKHFNVPADGESVLPDPLPPVLLFYSIQPTEKGLPVYEEIKESCRCNPLFYHDVYGDELAVLETFATGATKADAIKWLKDLSGADRVVAFGDNVNDIPMLRAADVAVAVENAIPEVKEMADIIIGDNNSDAVARFILTDSQFSTHEI